LASVNKVTREILYTGYVYIINEILAST